MTRRAWCSAGLFLRLDVRVRFVFCQMCYYICQMESSTLTTPEVARLVGVSTRRAAGYCQNGDIPGAYKTPRGRWRVPAQSLAKYTNGHAPTLPRILVVGADSLAGQLAHHGWQAVVCPSIWQAGFHLSRERWQGVLIDSAGATADAICLAIYVTLTFPDVVVGLLTYDGQSCESVNGVQCFRQPVTPEAMSSELRKAIG